MRYNTLMAQATQEPPVAEAPEQPVELQTQTEPRPQSEGDGGTISWTASEFVAHHKSPGWYGLLGLVAVLAAAVVYLVTKDAVAAAVIIAAAATLSVYASHQPREMQYRLDDFGITIGDKHFGYHEFRSFSVLPEGAFSSIVFMPLRRFAVPTTIYYAPEDEEQILNLLADRLPFEQARRDTVDNLMRRIRF